MKCMQKGSLMPEPGCAVPQSDPISCGLAWAAKVATTDLFLLGRPPEETLRESIAWAWSSPEELQAMRAAGDLSVLMRGVTVEVDQGRQAVTVRRGGHGGTARWTGPQGAVVVETPDSPLGFAPRAIGWKGPAPESPWPLGDAGALGDGPVAEVAGEALDLYFEDPRQMTNAVVIVHRGRIVGERYRAPWTADTPMQSWSMGKSIAGALVGRLIRMGGLSLDQDDLFEEWRQHADDPRRRISIRNLMNMASGLAFTGDFGRGSDALRKWDDGLYHDHTYVYAGGIDSAAFCLAKPAEHPAGSVGRYRNCDPLLALLAVRRLVEAQGKDFLEWPYRELFEPLGMGGMLLETDPFGHFLISGHDYGRARDWARLGLLHLRDGAVEGDQLLDPAFAAFCRASSPQDPVYGGFMITNRTGVLSTLPPDAFWMSGGGGQRTIVVPSLDLVIVRLGHVLGEGFGRAATMDKANGILASAARQ
jgi:CubicO group peptidase (beta-lactamase class C family)